MGNSNAVAFKKEGGGAMKNSSSEELDSYYPVRPECIADVPKTRFKARVGKTLSERRWNAAFSKEGYLDIAGVLRRIQRGGIHPSIKGAVWEFLLGCFDPESTFQERNQLRQQRREQYAAWKSECQKIVPVIGSGKIITSAIVSDDGQPIVSDDGQPIVSDDGQPIVSDDGQPIVSDDGQPIVSDDGQPIVSDDGQPIVSDAGQPIVSDDGQPIVSDDGQPIVSDDGQLTEYATNSSKSQDNNDAMPVDNGDFDKKMIQWKLSLHQIGLDVVRTDRTLVFYENEANQAKIWDILAVYAWMDKDIGYVQGMSDICSPMVILLENEADAYWCFERAMRRLRENFKCTTSSMGVQSQLSTLAQIVKTVDPKLHQHLEELDGGEYLFAFRMLMVLFRREFSFVDSLYLWEVMWAMEYNPNIYSSYDDKRQPNLSELLYDDKPNDKHKLKEYGKFERNNLKTGAAEQNNSALSVFLVASVLETKHRRLMKEAKGLDDVVQILGEISGNLDAKKALDEALKVHKKYLKQAKKS